MPDPAASLVKGTLDLLVLRTLELQPHSRHLRCAGVEAASIGGPPCLAPVQSTLRSCRSDDGEGTPWP